MQTRFDRNTFFHSSVVGAEEIKLWANLSPLIKIYTDGHHYFMISHAHVWALSYQRYALTQQASIDHPFVNTLLHLGPAAQYFCSVDGSTFMQMQMQVQGMQLCVDEQETVLDLLRFRTHELNEDHPGCQVCFSEQEAFVLKADVNVEPGDMPNQQDILSCYTRVSKEEQQHLLSNFINQSAHILALQSRFVPECLLRNPVNEEYIVVTCDYQDYHVKVGNQAGWRNLPVTYVEFIGIDGEKCIYFDNACGYHALYLSGSSQSHINSFMVDVDITCQLLMRIEHRYFDYSLIGFMKEETCHRPTLLDFESTPKSIFSSSSQR